MVICDHAHGSAQQAYSTQALTAVRLKVALCSSCVTAPPPLLNSIIVYVLIMTGLGDLQKVNHSSHFSSHFPFVLLNMLIHFYNHSL